jgi:hypothetical protein
MPFTLKLTSVWKESSTKTSSNKITVGAISPPKTIIADMNDAPVR